VHQSCPLYQAPLPRSDTFEVFYFQSTKPMAARLLCIDSTTGPEPPYALAAHLWAKDAA